MVLGRAADAVIPTSGRFPTLWAPHDQEVGTGLSRLTSAVRSPRVSKFDVGIRPISWLV